MKFLSPEVALNLYKYTIRPCMEYCFHVWAGAPNRYLELLDKLQKQICTTVCPSFAASLEPLAHLRNVVSLSLFSSYYFGTCSSELAELVPLPHSRGKSIHCSDRFHDFSVRHRHLRIVSSLKTDFLYAFFFFFFFFFFVLLFLVTLCLTSQWLFSLAWSESQLKKKRKENKEVLVKS